MRTYVKFGLLFLLLISVTSCQTYQMMHHNRSELDKVSADFRSYTVYIIDTSSTYWVDNAALTPNGIKGKLVPITDQAKIEEIKNPRTPKQLRKHKHDLDLYTKSEVTSKPKGVVLKKEDIRDVTVITGDKSKKFDPALYAEIIGVSALGVAVWVGIIYSFGGLL